MVNGTGSGVEPGFLEKPGFFPQTLGLGVETRFYLPTLEILKVWKVKVYIPWDSKPDKNVGFTSKPEVSKENPRFSKIMKFQNS